MFTCTPGSASCGPVTRSAPRPRPRPQTRGSARAGAEGRAPGAAAGPGRPSPDPPDPCPVRLPPSRPAAQSRQSVKMRKSLTKSHFHVDLF